MRISIKTKTSEKCFVKKTQVIFYSFVYLNYSAKMGLLIRYFFNFSIKLFHASVYKLTQKKYSIIKTIISPFFV